MLFAILLCALAEPEPNYHALREGLPTDTYRTENIQLIRDTGTVTLKNGQISFVKAALDRPVIGVFNGEGVFHLQPALPMEANYLAKVTGRADIEEAFDSAVFFFTDGTYDEVKSQASSMPLDPHAAQVLKNLRDKIKSGPNVAVDVLAEIANPKQGQSFRAFLHGKKNSDLRFLMVPSGALPEIQSPEETAVVNVDMEKGGIWYLSHLESEWKKGTVSSNENKREILATHYKIDTDVAKGGALTATTEMDFTSVMPGARVLHIDLLPSLRIKRVTDEKGREIGYIHESNSFVVLMPQPLEAGKNIG